MRSSHFWLLVLLAAGCATPPRADTTAEQKMPPDAGVEAPTTVPPEVAAAESASTPEEQRQALQALFAREAEPQPEQTVSAEAFQLKIEGKGAPAVQAAGEGQQMVNTDLGLTQPVSCVIASAYASATTLYSVATSIGESMNIRAARVREIDHVNGDPILHGEILYAPKNRPRSIGLVKVAVASGPRGGMLCTHDEPGYVKTFARVVRGAYASLQMADSEEEPEALWSELQVVRAQDTVAGYERRDLFASKEGGHVLVIRGAAAFFPSLERAIVMDSRSEEFTDAKGELTQQKYVQLIRGEVATEVELKRTGKGEYAYQGTRSGEPVKGTLTTAKKTPLASELTVAAHARRLLAAKKPTRLELEVYTPSADATKLDSLLLRQGPTEGTLLLGDDEAPTTATVAPDGTVSRSIGSGTAQVGQERIFERGTWPVK